MREPFLAHGAWRAGVAAAALALLVSCASPGSRISKNPALFATFPENVQMQVRQGKIDVGYTRDMVRIAKGPPDREYERRTKEGLSEVWSYVDYQYWTDRQRIGGSFRVRDSNGIMRTVKDSVWADVRQEREFETFRVEFRDGQVVGIEQLTR